MADALRPPRRHAHRLDCVETHRVHVSLIGNFPPSLWSSFLLSSVLFSLCALLPSRFSVIMLDVCITLVVLPIQSFLILSVSVTPHIHLNIHFSFVSVLVSCPFCCCPGLSSVQHCWSYYCSPSTSLASSCSTTLHCMSSSFSNLHSLSA